MSMEFISVASFYSSFGSFVILLFIVARSFGVDVIFSLSAIFVWCVPSSFES